MKVDIVIERMRRLLDRPCPEYLKARSPYSHDGGTTHKAVTHPKQQTRIANRAFYYSHPSLWRVERPQPDHGGATCRQSG